MFLISLFLGLLHLFTAWTLIVAISDSTDLINAIFPDRTVYVEKLPIIKYLQPNPDEPQYTGTIGVIDFHFNHDDEVFMQKVHPGWRRFLVGDPNPGLTYPVSYDWDVDHGSLVCHVMSHALPGARFLCLRLPGPYLGNKHKTYQEMQQHAQMMFPDPKFVMETFRDLGVRVVVMSLEVYLTEWLVDLSKFALANGIILVCSSTNSRVPLEKFPGIARIAEMNQYYPGLVLWATSDIRPHVRWKLAAYSNDDTVLQYLFATAGVDVFIKPGQIASGSSIAAPILASMVVLLMDYYPSCTAKDILYLLTELSISSPGILVKSLWDVDYDNCLEMYHLDWIKLHHWIGTERMMINMRRAERIYDAIDNWLYEIGYID